MRSVTNSIARERWGIGREAQGEIKRLLKKKSIEEGQNATCWTTPRIAEHLDQKLCVDVHEDTARSALKQMEYGRTCPRRRLPSTDPEAYREQPQAIFEVVVDAGPEPPVFAKYGT